MGPRATAGTASPCAETYAQGVAWVGMILARALHYAHGMQTFHRDVKPGNVLITIHHGPQLLDFNLAESPHSAEHAESAMLGGTLPYMAPEQIEAFLNPDLWGTRGREGRHLFPGAGPAGAAHRPGARPAGRQAPARAVDARPARSPRLLADRCPTLRPGDPPRPGRHRPVAAWPSTPKDRYPDGRGLAEDLERFLNRKPLHHVTNPSRRERVANWAARNGKSLAAATFTIMLGTMIGFLASPSIRNHLNPPLESVAAYRQARLDIEQGRYDEGIRKLEGLQADYPAHPFLLLYLSRAHVERPQLPGDEAHRYFQKVMESPDGEHALREWAAHDPGAVKHLEKMGTTWADNLYVSSAYRNDAAARSPADSRTQHETNDPQRAYASAILKVLDLALELDPSAQRLRAKIAMAEEILERYEEAYGDLTELIDQVRSSDDFRLLNSLTIWIVQLPRVAVRLAASLGDSSDPAQRDRALPLLRETAAELNHRAFTASFLAPSPGNNQQASVNSFLLSPSPDRGAAEAGGGRACPGTARRCPARLQ